MFKLQKFQKESPYAAYPFFSREIGLKKDPQLSVKTEGCRRFRIVQMNFPLFFCTKKQIRNKRQKLAADTYGKLVMSFHAVGAVTQLIGKSIVCFHLHEAGHLENYLFQREIGAFQNGSIPAASSSAY